MSIPRNEYYSYFPLYSELIRALITIDRAEVYILIIADILISVCLNQLLFIHKYNIQIHRIRHNRFHTLNTVKLRIYLKIFYNFNVYFHV